MFLRTKARFAYLTDIDMFLWYQASIRGGFVQTSHRFQTVCPEGVEPSVGTDGTLNHDSGAILYLDINALYSFAMKQYLPYGDYKWCTADEVKDIDWKTISLTDNVGYTVECDIGYDSAEAVEKHRDYLLAPEVCCVNFEEMSPMSQHYVRLNGGIAAASKTTRLIAHGGKRRLTLHFSELQSCLKYGMTLYKVHRAVRFSQAPLLSPHIDHCMEQRRMSLSEFEKIFWKMFSNCTYGKNASLCLSASKLTFFFVREIRDEQVALYVGCRRQLGQQEVHHALLQP